MSVSLPSFTPLRDRSQRSEKAESSTSGSKRSARSSSRDEPSPSQTRDSNSFGSLTEDTGVGRTIGSVRRSKPRSSGGFLLDIGRPSRISRTFLSRSKREKPDVKGKGPGEEVELNIPKQRARDVRHEKRQSISGSPLASEIRQDTEDELHLEGNSLIPGTDIRHSTVSQGSNYLRWRSSHPGMGFDTDPAQIVNMALTLSEKRRRNASGRLGSGPAPGSRVVSAAIPSSPALQKAYQSQHLTPPQNISRLPSQVPDSISPKSNGVTRQSEQAFIGDSGLTDEEMTEDGDSFIPSQATQARVEKAKTYFELAYEHRRLLQHLPPIRRPSTGLQVLSGKEVTKTYNPLQYARNRKLRFTEQKPISSEDEGWHDIQQVRSWVDAVISSHSGTIYDPDECVRLPDLAHNKISEPESDLEDEEKDPMLLDSLNTSVHLLNNKKNAKPRRPRSDWVTHPGDLIADAAWSEQGLNKLKIEDRDGNKIYPPDTHFRFTGWRNHTPIHIPEGLQEPISPPEKYTENLPTPPPSALPELPTFISAHQQQKLEKHNGRRTVFRDKLIASKNRKRSQERHDEGFGGGPDSFDSFSSGGDTDDEGSVRGRRQISRKRQKSHDTRKNRLDSKLQNTSDQESLRRYDSSARNSYDQSAHSSNRPSVDHSKLSKFFGRTDLRKQGSNSRSTSTRRDSITHTQSRNSYDAMNPPRSSAEYDTTAPTSPAAFAFPSIAINLSPPTSRSPSPSKRPLIPILDLLRERSHSKAREQQGVDTNDFGQKTARHSREHSSDGDKGHSSSDHSRGTSPMTRGTSPMTRIASLPTAPHGGQVGADDHRGSIVSKTSVQSSAPSTTDQRHKVRGIFKGGRIAELVGNEVSKVGEFIWKRDVPTPYRVVRGGSTSTASLGSHHASDTDDEFHPNGTTLKTPPRQHEKRFPSSENAVIRAKRLSPSSESQSSPDSGKKLPPEYHNPNLPTFTSPFERDRDAQEERKRSLLTPTSSPPNAGEQDHVSLLAAQHRANSRSPRLDRLAPPRLAITQPPSVHGSISADPLVRQNSYDFGDNSSRNLSKSRNASQIFNDVLMPKNAMMISGLASLKASRSNVDLVQSWNASQQNLNDMVSEADVSKRDIARTFALLYSSAIKARELALRAEEYRDPLPKFVRDTIDPSNSALHVPTPVKVRRREEHLMAARNLITSLTKDANGFSQNLTAFQNDTSPGLHRALQAVEDMVDNSLTPRVRKSADEAGELSMKLATNSTLAIKGMNEKIDAALRRRRRGPVRWLRRFGYLAIEWFVVALLWGIWAVVTVARVVRGTIGFLIAVMRWLLFLS